MYSGCLQALFLVVSLQLCVGQDNFGTLLKRIEALETRDADQSARIEFLEKQAKVSRDKQNQLSVSNDVLHQSLPSILKKLGEYEKTMASLYTQLEQEKSVANSYKEKAELFQTEVDKLKESVNNTNKMFAVYTSRFEEKVKDIAVKFQKHIEHGRTSSTQSPGPRGRIQPLSDNTKYILQRWENETMLAVSDSAEEVETRTIELRTLEKVPGESSKTLQEKENTQNENYHQRRVLETTEMVAFHAVLSPHTTYHLGTKDNIKFDHIRLNEGGGYHDQHGLFIAPKSGFYLFSATIGTNFDAPFYASIRRNGAVLANIAGDGESGPGSHLDQGSVTIVTKLNTGDEVWVVHTAPADGSIWGNSFTSFAGVLIAEF